MNAKKVTDLEYQYKYEKQQNTIEEQNTQKKTLTYFIIAGIISTIIILILLFFLNKSRMKVKQQLKIIDTDKKKLEVLLIDKETLLKEVHHRVKNNFAVILSFLEFQLMDADQENVSKTLNETKNRINTISLAHELIYGEFLLDKDYRYINLKNYIISITSAVVPHGSSAEKINIKYK